MKHNYKNFEIEILDNPNYILNSVNNLKQYEKVYFDEKHPEDEFCPTSKHAITVNKFGSEISNAIICEVGGGTGIYENAFIIDNDKIWIRICNKIYCLEIPSLDLIWNKEFDTFTNLSIYQHENDILIHGELEIFRITKEGNIVWSFGGRDIWVNIEGIPEFTIEESTIRLFDFESNEYVIDFNGNQIEDNPRIIPKKIKKKWWQIFG
ncbi:hypothetical protein [Flavobacterium pectinovorum]|uniref:Uncharacterized protein n=1 Tax=Flavobacterium pectinovorum TaxID=29533 RepID=A0AB36P628_9FLAO|nr:hypothetical protein [Flavobacterium pectinovorum]OXB07870.1 hypothetical protein B0A72_03145 [Flavobacterium pectinovorum]SHM83126.1 hypothetical protein SAMN05444387_3332 [Flavobacterium pectinovorum]